jgi:TonB family protein
MLDQLVESRDTRAENSRKGVFLLITLAVISTSLLTGLIVSLLTFDAFGAVGNIAELQKMLQNPTMLSDDTPPPPPPKEEKVVTTSDKILVKGLVERLDRTSTPPKDTLGRRDTKEPPPGVTRSNIQASDRGGDLPTGSGLSGIGGGGDGDGDGPPPPPPTPRPTPPTRPISGGVLNGRAVNLVTPSYPPAARAVRASGTVDVQVVIDENGNVINATASSGHPLLRPVAVQAARQSKFSPTLLSGNPVKVEGVIRYNFVAP